MGVKKVYLLGDVSTQAVSGFIDELKKAGVEVEVPRESGRFNLALLCFTEQPFTNEMWRVIDVNRNARFIPVLFPGGEIPAIYADIKPADFRQNEAQAMAGVLVAIARLS